MLDRLAESAFRYFDSQSHSVTGLVSDSTSPGSSASIAATGMALGAFVVASERGFITRAEARRRVDGALRFLGGRDVNGFFFHFLNTATGERAGRCEVSTMDSALLFAGALTAAEYFDGEDPAERELRRLATDLYLAANWHWASPRAPVVSHGWTPERGFLRYDWRGYNEALLLYILALGSPTYPVPEAAYDAWVGSYKWKSLYGYEHLYGGPLFMHQMPHAWVDFRGISDKYMRARGSDYFENSRRATHVQRAYAMRNPRKFAGYGENCWGVSASAGPGDAGFHGYRARGVPYGLDDGTIAPWATAASLPFAPEIVLPALEHMELNFAAHGAAPCFNRTYAASGCADGWVSPFTYGIDQGPVALMVENYRTGLIWRLLRKSPYVRRGLERAGFTGGWLESDTDC